MLGPKEKKNRNKENKFKPEDIITNLKTPTWYFRPVQEWIDNINMNSATWKVISVDDKNGDYTLQRLEAITTKRILEDDGPIYQKERIMRKNLIDCGLKTMWKKYIRMLLLRQKRRMRLTIGSIKNTTTE